MNRTSQSAICLVTNTIIEYKNKITQFNLFPGQHQPSHDPRLLSLSAAAGLRRNIHGLTRRQPARLPLDSLPDQPHQQPEQPLQHCTEPDTSSTAILRMHLATSVCNADRPGVSSISLHKCPDILVQVECPSGSRSPVRARVSSPKSSARSVDWSHRWHRSVVRSDQVDNECRC